jgi:hypothetical protein
VSQRRSECGQILQRADALQQRRQAHSGSGMGRTPP